MKKLIAFLVLASMQMTPVMAHVGGPWSSNTYDSHTDGLYGGSMTFSYGSGIFRFIQTSTAQMGALNSSMLYYKGVTFLGSCQCNIDTVSKSVDGITNGSAYNHSPAAAQQRTAPLNDNNANFEPQRAGQSGVTQPNVPTNPYITNGALNLQPFSFAIPGTSGPVGIGNTNWSGKLTSTAPNIRFKARGQAAFFGLQTSTLRFHVVQDPSFTTTVLGANGLNTTNIVPGVIHEVQVDQGGNDPFPNPTNTSIVHVLGSRISYNVSASINGQGGVLDGTGGGGFAF